MFGEMTDSDVDRFIRDNFQDSEVAYVTWHQGCPTVSPQLQSSGYYAHSSMTQYNGFAIPHTACGFGATLLEYSNSESLERDYPEWIVNQDNRLWFIADNRKAAPEDYYTRAEEVLNNIVDICADITDDLFYDEEDYRERLQERARQEWESLGVPESEIPWDDMGGEWCDENFGEYIYIPKEYFAQKFPHLTDNS